MAWKGFLQESKSYMSYPKNRISFWIYYPIAWLKFQYFMMKDKSRKGRNNARRTTEGTRRITASS